MSLTFSGYALWWYWQFHNREDCGVDLKGLGRRVATAIEAAGMTQAQVAERVGCDPSKVSNLVRGVRARLDVEFLAEVAEALGTTVEALFAPDPPDTPSELREALDAMRVFAETWRLAIETERERVANERLRIETAAAVRTAEIAQVEAVDAQARLFASEDEVVRVTTLWPVEGPRGTVRGRVVGPLAPPGTDCLIHITVCDVPTLLPARRVNRCFRNRGGRFLRRFRDARFPGRCPTMASRCALESHAIR